MRANKKAMRQFGCVLFRYSNIVGSFYRNAHDPPFEKGSLSVLMLENHIKNQISYRESIYESKYLVRAAGSHPEYAITKCKTIPICTPIVM